MGIRGGGRDRAMVTACEKEGDTEKIKPIGRHLLISPWRKRPMQQFISPEGNSGSEVGEYWAWRRQKG